MRLSDHVHTIDTHNEYIDVEPWINEWITNKMSESLSPFLNYEKSTPLTLVLEAKDGDTISISLDHILQNLKFFGRKHTEILFMSETNSSEDHEKPQFVADDVSFIAKRLKEIKAEREKAIKGE